MQPETASECPDSTVMLMMGRSQSARTRIWGVIDALRRVEGPARPGVIDQLGHETEMTVADLGRQAHLTADRHRRVIGKLTSRWNALQSDLSQAIQSEALAQRAASSGEPATSKLTDRREAQLRRKARMAANVRSNLQGELEQVQERLAEAIAAGTSALEAIRQNARLVQECGLVQQASYWSHRIRWHRRKHGDPPLPEFYEVSNPDWISNDDVLDITTLIPQRGSE